MTTAQDLLLNELLYCYQEGSEVPKETVRRHIPADNVAERQAMRLLRKRLTKSEFVSLHLNGGYVRDIMHSTRTQQFADAEEHVTDGYAALERAALTGIAREMSITHLAAAESYLLYKQGKHAAATARMERSLLATERLIGDDMLTFEGRRNHLEHNLMRVDCFAGNHVAALDRAFDNLLFLAGDVDRGPFDAPRNARLLDSSSAELKQAYAYAFLHEMAVLFALPVSAETPELSTRTEAAIAAFSEHPEHHLFAVPLAWLQLKLDLWRNSADYLPNAMTFLKQGRNGWPVLWHAVVKDVYDSFQTEQHPTARAMCERFVADSADERLPAPLRLTPVA